MLYNFFQKKRKDIKKDKQIAALVESIKELKEVIKKTEQEITNIQSNFKEAKEKLCRSGRNLFEKIKKGLMPSGQIKECADVQPESPLKQKVSDAEEEKKEVKEVEKNPIKKTANTTQVGNAANKQ
jgi:hypothetical protein